MIGIFLHCLPTQDEAVEKHIVSDFRGTNYATRDHGGPLTNIRNQFFDHFCQLINTQNKKVITYVTLDHDTTFKFHHTMIYNQLHCF
jgi:hypothetical protein